VAMPSFVAKDSAQKVTFRVRNLRGGWDTTTDVSAGDLQISVSGASAAAATGSVTNLGNAIPGLRVYTMTSAETAAEGKVTLRMRRAGLISGGADIEVAVPVSMTSAGLINTIINGQTTAASINVNVSAFNGVAISGVGTSANPWGPA